MKKNILIIALIVISLTSILYNIITDEHNSELIQYDEKRTKEAFHRLVLLRSPYNLTHAQGDSVAFIKSTQIALGEIENDLIEISGGIDSETGKLVNTHAINTVNDYFYSDNLTKPFASQHIDSLINNYLEQFEQLGLESSLKASVNQLRNNEGFFRNLTVAESIMLLELIKNRISFDERRITNGC